MDDLEPQGFLAQFATLVPRSGSCLRRHLAAVPAEFGLIQGRFRVRNGNRECMAASINCGSFESGLGFLSRGFGVDIRQVQSRSLEELYGCFCKHSFECRAFSPGSLLGGSIYQRSLLVVLRTRILYRIWALDWDCNVSQMFPLSHTMREPTN